MNRRDFLKLSAYITVALKAGLINPTSAISSSLTTPPKLTGNIFAACYNPKKEGEFSRKTHQSVLSRLNLETGVAQIVPFDLLKAHDALKVQNNEYLILPSSQKSNFLYVSDFDGHKQKIHLPEYCGINGHAFFDKKENTIIVPTANGEENGRGEFFILDAKNYKIIDHYVTNNFYPHDIQLLDQNTLAVCNYNVDRNGYNDSGFRASLLNNQSILSLHDRKTLKWKKNIPAYNNIKISHTTITNNGDLFAIGNREYHDESISSWSNEYIEDKFESFFKENHSELLTQWPDIVKHTPLHRVEKSTGAYGLPTLPMKMANGSNNLQIIPFNHYHHRRPQSICYVPQTNTVCMAFPNSDSILLYNATTNKSASLNGKDLNLKEMRGITPIENTPYLAIAGIRRGFTIIDTTTNKIIQHFDIGIGRIIHMHHEV